tara:strand:+ start:154 stop:1068 length:915 start_codon:yes stop_codon:yes gene_type:complete
MSNKIIGNFSKKFQKNKNITVLGKRPKWMAEMPNINVDVPSRVNRDTKATTIEKHLNLSKGFNWDLWDPPKVAKLPNGKMFLYDGDHSRAMYKLAFPKENLMPVAVREISTLEEIHQLFHLVNGGARKNVSAEERFVHQFLSGDVKTINTADQLSQCGLSVYCSNESNGSVGNPSHPKTKIRGFRKAISTSSVDCVKQAAEMIVSTFGSADEVHSELLEGLSIVYNDYPEVAPGGVYENKFSSWFLANKVNDQRPMATTWKNRGGCVHNRQGASVARGIMSLFLNQSKSPAPKMSLNRLAKRGV